MAKASDNIFPKIIEAMQTTDPAAPSDSTWKLYAKAPGIYARSSNTIIGPFGTSGSSDLAGKELDYVQITSPVSVTATSEATANTIVTGSSVAYDGSTVVMVEFWCNHAAPDTGAAPQDLRFWLYDGSSSIGFIGYMQSVASGNRQYAPVYGLRRLTPSNASHTYSIRGSVAAGTGTVQAGAGGSGNTAPAFIRIFRVTS